MNPVAVGVIFFLLWWLTFFTVLPTGVKSRHEEEEHDGVIGADPGAPVDPELKRKLLTTTIIAAVLTVLVSALVASGWFFHFRG